jgi:hypothetical protein
MALDFLGQLGGAASNIGGIINALGIGKPKMNYGPSPSEAQANSLFQALLDPNNSLVKQNTDVNLMRGMQSFLMQLRQMQMLQNRNTSRGVRGAFFNPERADETINFLTTRGLPAMQEQARDKATSDIRSTATGLSGFAKGEQDRINAQNKNRGIDYQNFQTQGGWGGAIKQGVGGIQDLLKILGL